MICLPFLGYAPVAAAVTMTSSDSSITVVEAPAGTFDLTASAATVGALPLAGGTMAGNIDMGGFSVINTTLDQVTTGISDTTASMGLAHRYVATAADVTITVSTADFVEGREFIFGGVSPSIGAGSPVTIATEGAQLIVGQTEAVITVNGGSLNYIVRAGNLESME